MLSFFEKRKERRLEFVRTELQRYNNDLRTALNNDSSITNKTKYYGLLTMNRYANKYSKLFGEDKTNRLFKSFNYETLKDFIRIKEKFGRLLTPREMNEKLQLRENKLPRLEGEMKRLYNVMEKALGGDPLTIFPINTQLHNLRRYYKIEEQVKQIKEEIGVLKKPATATKELVSIQPKNVSYVGKLLDGLGKMPCCSKPKTVEM